MRSREECPICGKKTTRREMLDDWTDRIEEIRTCECGAEYVNQLFLDHQEVTHEP